MKYAKYIVMVLFASMLLAGCGKKEEPGSAPEQQPESSQQESQ